MKRSPIQRKTPLRQRRREGADIEREPKPLALATVKPPVRGTYAGGIAGPTPKAEPYRDPALLEMARNRPCMLLVPGVCNHRIDTTVAAHSNLSIHGKGGARKADDCYVVEACSACHYWLDFGKAGAATKLGAFTNGHALQVLAWRLRAADQSEPERFRRAAARALERLA